MASIGSLGIGSGMDLNGLLDKIQASEQAPLMAIQRREAAVNARLSAYGTLKGLLTGLQTAANKLADTNFMNGFAATSSASSVVTVTADTTSAAGSYSVNVAKIAKAQSMASADVATTTDAIGTLGAKITISFGSVDLALDSATGKYPSGATFTPDGSKTPITLTLDAGKTSLANVRDAINQAAGGAVNASIVNDGTGNRLVLASTATGANAVMQVAVDATIDPATGLANSVNTDLQNLIAVDPAGTQNMTTTVAAQDAALTVNGIAVTSHANSVAGAIQGVTMSLVDAGASTVTVARDTGSVKAAINDFVNAYNTLSKKVASMTSYSAGSNMGGVLLGDATARLVQERLRSTLFQAHTGLTGDPSRVSEIGIAFQKDGTLALNDTQLSAALSANPTGVTRLFAGNDSSDATGFADNFSSAIDRLIADKDGEDQDGTITAAMNGGSRQLAALDKQAGQTQDRIDATMAQYRTQFQQLDLLMSNMTATSNYLSQQLSALAPSKSK
jgi:flagellar hook-associated protein 2